MTNEFVALSDIHGNYPALRSVIDREGDDAEYMVLGDIHGLNACPQETLELVQEVGNFVLAGNHDKALFHYGEGHVNDGVLSRFERDHTLGTLSAAQCKYMCDLPYMEIVQRGGSRICLTHALPWPEKASGYELGNTGIEKSEVTRFAAIVADDYDYVFHGHTHEQYELDCNKFSHDVHFVNPGTLGYQGEYAVVDTKTGEIELKEVEYDRNAVREHVQSHLPSDAPHTKKWF